MPDNVFRYAQRETSCCSNSDDSKNGIFGNRTRYIVLILATLCLSSILGNVLTFNFTIICMTSSVRETVHFSHMNDSRLKTIDNDTVIFEYSPLTKSMLFSAVAIGALVAFPPITLLLNNIGSRSVFGLIGFISAISTALVPLAASA
uniref:Uncharacterized protein n=1 Tax=Plectus sambesii TaxID=2011161 RepID=A0A914XD62_9BILA